MADQQQLDLLRQGSDAWNTWRKQYREVRPNLREANLRGAELNRADFSGANLFRANLNGANLSRANLSTATLIETTLDGATIDAATIGWTFFGNVDLRFVKGLETIIHQGPSSIGVEMILRSEGTIPDIFLRKAGLSDTFITYARSLAQNPIAYYTCFISYSSKDQKFADRLYTDLQSNGVRYWFAPKDMKTGDTIRHRIDESIRLYDKLLLVLSLHSIKSSWVEFEVEAALAKENMRKPPVLFPVRLDDSIIKSKKSWAAHIQRTRHITDFTNWKQHEEYQKALTRLLRDLQPDASPKKK